MDIKKIAKWIEANYTQEETEEYIKAATARTKEIQAYYKNTAELCEEAMQLEKDGKLLEAIIIYEGLLKENFEGSRPYDRLAVIYRKLKKQDNIIRVLEKAVKIQEKEYNRKAKIISDINKYPGYRAKLDKYKAKLEKEKSK